MRSTAGWEPRRGRDGGGRAQVARVCEAAVQCWWEDTHPGWMIFTLGNQHFQSLDEIIQARPDRAACLAGQGEGRVGFRARRRAGAPAGLSHVPPACALAALPRSWPGRPCAVWERRRAGKLAPTRLRARGAAVLAGGRRGRRGGDRAITAGRRQRPGAARGPRVPRGLCVMTP